MEHQSQRTISTVKSDPKSRDLLRAAATNNSTPDLLAALTPPVRQNPQLLQDALNFAVSSGSKEVVIHLLDVEHVSAQSIPHSLVANHVSVPWLEILVSHGYDFDRDGQEDTIERGMNLIDHPQVLKNDEVVCWLVEHGARLDRGQDRYALVAMPPPLLETAAAHASVSTFKYLHERGAKLGRRTLHGAVELAAFVKADPAAPPDHISYDPSKKHADTRKRIVEMLVYLVDDLGLDVNARDIDVESPPSGHYGTPLGYAVFQGGVAVVRWLLAKGADPMIGGDSRLDASLLKPNEKIQEIFEEWQEERASRQGAT